MCHLLLGLPVLALPVFWLWPLSIAAPIYGVVAVASLVIYAYAVKAMRMPRLNGLEGMLGASGTVAQVGERRATLLVHGELWTADADGEKFAVGDQAVILGVDGLRLRARKRSGAGGAARDRRQLAG